MKLSTIKIEGRETAAVAGPSGLVTLEQINRTEGTDWPSDLYELLRKGELDKLKVWYSNGGREKLAQMSAVPEKVAVFAPLYRHPRKIWGIGMNYVSDAAELDSISPDEEPVGFMKPDTSIIGPGDAIRIPEGSDHTTAEAELAIIIGKECRHITEEEAPGYVAGITTSLDMTEAAVHARNPRFLTRAKSYDTFFSYGPQLHTLEECPDILNTAVETVINGEVRHRNVISNMRFRPWFTVAFHSRVMTLLPGDIIITGTPGPVLIRAGDQVECRIGGFRPLINPVEG